MFKQMQIRNQMLIGFVLVVGLFELTLLLVGLKVSTQVTQVRQLAQHSLPFVLTVDEMDLMRSDVQQFLTDVSATHDPDGYRDAEASAKRFQAGIRKYREHYIQENDRSNLAKLDALEHSFNQFYELGKQMAKTYVDQGMAAGNLIMKGSSGKDGFDKLSETLNAQMKELREQEVSDTTASADTAYASANQILYVMVIGSVCAAGMALLMALLIIRSVVSPIKVASQAARAVADGDLTVEVNAQGNNEAAHLLQSLHDMRASLLKVISDVRLGTDSVATASAQIAQGNQDLAGRTASQASSLEETAASMEEISVQVKHNAESARRVNQLAASASTIAVRGGAVVGRVVQTMKEINDSSRKIADIIGVIDGIAFQTNILALNAAVEAARAGEQGRGFAVVASEVRSLAGRSAQAAKEIKTLINASVERVDAGTTLVDEAGSTMGEVVTSIRQVGELVSSISLASDEQAAGVAQIGEAVGQMEHTTQQNAALVEEMAAAAASLDAQAGDLVQAISVFKLDNQSGVLRPRLRPSLEILHEPRQLLYR
jgi:methyl-accepting chemotaxis protein